MTMFFEDGAAHPGLQMTLRGGRPWSHVTGLEATGGVSNYLGNSHSKRALNNVPHYSCISIAGVYPGVDLNFYQHQDHLEYDFVVHPGADPKQIQLAFAGQKEMRLDNRSGDLVVTTASGAEMRQAHPNVYQQLDRRVEVAGQYKILDGSRVAFQLATYDPQRPLIIDPAVSFGTFLNYAQAYAVAVDKQGNSYITGSASEGFRVTDHSVFKDCHDNGFGGCTSMLPDIFVTKLSSSGTVLFSSFQGNGGGTGIVVDSTGIYVAATDANGDGPLAFKLDLYGNPIYRQVLALPDYQIAAGIAVDSQHNAWVTGATWSESHGNNNRDVWLVKLNPQGSVLSSQTIGGGGIDEANSIAVDSADNPWVTGETCSGDFPATPGLNNLRDKCGIFVMALTNQSPASIRFASVFAGSGGLEGVAGDAGTAIAVNAYGEAYITGYTTGFYFPVVPGAYQSYPSSPGMQAFVCKLDNNGHLVYSTLLGGDGNTFGHAIALNAAGEVYVAGNTSSTNFPENGPMTLGSGYFYTASAGFIAKFSPDLSALIYSRQTGDWANVAASRLKGPRLVVLE